MSTISTKNLLNEGTLNEVTENVQVYVIAEMSVYEVVMM